LTILVGFIPIIPPVRLVDPLPPVVAGGVVGAGRGEGRGKRGRWDTVPRKIMRSMKGAGFTQLPSTDAAVEIAFEPND